MGLRNIGDIHTGNSGAMETVITWQPQPGPQKALIDCPLPEIFYGGARGGGKTDGVLGKYAIKGETYGAGFNALFFRKELPMLDDAIERSRQIFEPLKWKWSEQKKSWKSPAGARLRFRPLERVTDAEKYQGQNISDACIEEVGNYADPAPINRINGVLRSVSGVPTQLLLTGNPGGPGQHWIREKYINPHPGGMKVLEQVLPNGKRHKYVFIPSKVEQNRLLLKHDPEYINRLYLVGSKELVRAWLEGDWSAVEGAFFDNWSNKNIVTPFEIPSDWLKFRAFDWGSAKPFSVGWWAIARDDYRIDGLVIPRGAMVRYREWYGATGPNKGLRLTAEQVSEGITDREDEKITYSVADPAIFTEDGGPSIAERMRPVNFIPADNKRVAGSGHMGGWDQMRARIIGDNNQPMIYTFNTCTDSIRTIPTLQHDPHKAEDLDTESEDHAADEWRYACMSRPWIRPLPDPKAKRPSKWDRAFDADEDESWATM